MNKHLIIGAGGTGGAIASYMGKAGQDVTVIARGEHLKAIQEQGGLRVIRPEDEFFAPMKAADAEHYDDKPDVIFVCVKGYSVDSVLPLIRRISDEHTIVIPILNIYGTGGEMQKQLPGILVTDGCIYVASEKKAPGEILMRGLILRVVFGVRESSEYRPELEQIKADLNASGIEGILSDNIRRDAMVKFSYVSPQGAVGLYYNIPAGSIQKPGKYRDAYAGTIREIVDLSHAMGITFEEDLVQRNLDILDSLSPEMTTSMQKDVAAGHASEIDGLIYGVVRLGDRYGVEMPLYHKIAKELKRRGL